MKFSKEYSKLRNDVFHTIRKAGYYKVGQWVKITTPDQKFSAEVIHVIPILKKQIDNNLAIADADCSAPRLIMMLEKWHGRNFDHYELIYLRKGKRHQYQEKLFQE